MRMKADHWVNYNGRWYAPGEEYEYGVPEAEVLAQPIAEPVQETETPASEPEKQETPRRARKRKAE